MAGENHDGRGNGRGSGVAACEGHGQVGRGGAAQGDLPAGGRVGGVLDKGGGGDGELQRGEHVDRLGRDAGVIGLVQFKDGVAGIRLNHQPLVAVAKSRQGQGQSVGLRLTRRQRVCHHVAAKQLLVEEAGVVSDENLVGPNIRRGLAAPIHIGPGYLDDLAGLGARRAGDVCRRQIGIGGETGNGAENIGVVRFGRPVRVDLVEGIQAVRRDGDLEISGPGHTIGELAGELPVRRLAARDRPQTVCVIMQHTVGDELRGGLIEDCNPIIK